MPCDNLFLAMIVIKCKFVRYYAMSRLGDRYSGQSIRLVTESSRDRLLAGALPVSLGQLSLPSLRQSGVGKSSTGYWLGLRRGVCDPMWQVMPRSCVMGFVSLRAIHSFNLSTFFNVSVMLL